MMINFLRMILIDYLMIVAFVINYILILGNLKLGNIQKSTNLKFIIIS
jgi:hypothetical protein